MFGLTPLLVSIVLGLALSGLQTLRLSNERTAHERTRTQMAEARTGHETERRVLAEKLSELTNKAKEAEFALAEQAAQERKALNEQITSLSAARRDLERRLRVQSANAATAALMPSTSPPAEPGQAARVDDAAELSPAVGRLLDEAQRADSLRLALLSCYRTYDAAKAMR